MNIIVRHTRFDAHSVVQVLRPGQNGKLHQLFSTAVDDEVAADVLAADLETLCTHMGAVVDADKLRAPAPTPTPADPTPAPQPQGRKQSKRKPSGGDDLLDSVVVNSGNY